MNLKRVAERLAAERGISSKKAERLLEAEARLIKEYFKPLKVMSNDEIIAQRYTKSGAVNELAAIDVVPIIMQVYNTPDAPAVLVESANDYIKETEALGGIDISGFEGAFKDFPEGAKHQADITKELTNILAHKEEYRGDWAEIEKAARKTYGLRQARSDVEAEFQRLLKKGFNKDEFSNFIESIQAELDKFMYDEGYAESYEVIND